MAASLAGKVRRVPGGDTDEFDLGGYSRDKCADFVKVAFVDPFVVTGMPKITFVCGGGKETRQKYGEGLVRDFCQSLDAIGFQEDNAACQEISADQPATGRYKYQHDTNKNLKFVHVFPRVEAPEAEEEEVGEDGEPARGGPREPADVLAECEVDDFRRMVGSFVTSYATKKRLFDSLRERLARLDEAEKKLIAREQLDASLQTLYDNMNVDGLKEKAKIMAAEMQSCIDAGEITPEEKVQISEQLDGKFELLETELAKAEADGKAKMQAKLEEQKEKLKATKKAVSDARAQDPAPLKYAAEIQKLHKRLAGLKKLEKESAGKYTMDQLKALGEAPEMEEAMAVLKTRSHLWFESDDEFKVRLRHCLAQAAPSSKKASGSGYPAAATKSDGFTTVKKR